MLVLALDTSTPACAVALVELGALPVDPRRQADRAPQDQAPQDQAAAGRALFEWQALFERAVWDARRHGELLAPLVAEALAEAGIRPPDLAAVVVGAGPGPFTSLRVGMVTGAAFGAALGIPVHGVCSLDGIGTVTEGPVGVITDARRREVFWARYQDGTRVGEPGVGAPAAVVAQLRASGATRVTGPGVALYPEVFAEFGHSADRADRADRADGADGADGPLVPGSPAPAVLVRCVAADILGGRTPAPLVPLYLRRPDAAEPRPPKTVTVAG
ncbi:tRNA N6-adenosine(37)-N6-threonylcarbamoyltransferase complex dimerization subunit TsaB [Parafrankia colletiae]|uniref:tRNA N6-adenosine(37)-N6-threonylcarbamoyltransferase complex dimerization subunit TsaB n=1 Tax=Parafrankia colletiae TaxID=573497 RepID=A0A1S1R038_9ACTN|nr:tRNA (adenosine(37)-N6)-threonylcarbamoyltransferase complex dimerization subunit type 1 TsaB [Parafrankia colletiae]MCK9899366.1 tRNA (adenosine(37)-N6)-threonylcarbamoyltransferase complex dimerization subunit type 1 TsaB [Frankia sp. Cpl3]OHV38885.1 tRNA N6-adenosine(37)-N6-threonylcarbamoyltransferase complex dimerization subunit TsaB [Parafrankia colletiae]